MPVSIMTPRVIQSRGLGQPSEQPVMNAVKSAITENYHHIAGGHQRLESGNNICGRGFIKGHFASRLDIRHDALRV